jgi:hypothetical protein
MKAAFLVSMLFGALLPFQSPALSQGLSDVEISAGYCFGALDTYVRAFEAWRPPDIDEVFWQKLLSYNKQYRADRERLRSYLVAKGLFSPSRALDVPLLRESIDRGKADVQLCNNEFGGEPLQSCAWKCATSYPNDTRARNACDEGCLPDSCKRQLRCEHMTWLPF